VQNAENRLRELHARIALACERAGRQQSEVTLVGASKTVPVQRVRQFLDAGLTDLGENYVQEGVAKIAALHAEPTAASARRSVRWHLIGALQSNKARAAVQAFDVIHSVDRHSLAVALDRAARTQGKVQEVLLQVNVGNEVSKAGCAPQELRPLAEACKALPNIAVRGLMCLPPYHEDAEQSRPYFQQLREARDALFDLFDRPGVFFSPQSAGVSSGFGHLSMGMTNNFEVAIEEGATLVRIGTGLFGGRAAPSG
jgi:pyridoxal phosphate enzyme (YggS family)